MLWDQMYSHSTLFVSVLSGYLLALYGRCDVNSKFVFKSIFLVSVKKKKVVCSIEIILIFLHSLLI